MPRRQVDPEQTKLKRQQRNQRYRANLETTERNKGRNTLYQQKKHEQARLAQHPNLYWGEVFQPTIYHVCPRYN